MVIRSLPLGKTYKLEGKKRPQDFPTGNIYIFISVFEKTKGICFFIKIAVKNTPWFIAILT